MNIMQHHKGFSLIETLVAIIIASISAVALLQVVSTASRSSGNLLEHFDDLQMIGLISSMIKDESENETLILRDLVSEKYKIDHSEILESLDPYRYTLNSASQEDIDPISGVVGITASHHYFSLQKVTINDAAHSKSFFRILEGNHE